MERGMSLRVLSFIVLLLLSWCFTVGAQTGQNSSTVTVFDWQDLKYKNYDVTSFGTGNRRSVNVFDWQDMKFKNYDVTSFGVGNQKSVNVFDWQDLGFKNYGVTTRGTGNWQSVNVFDWQDLGFKNYDVTTYGTGNRKTTNVWDWQDSDLNDSDISLPTLGGIGRHKIKHPSESFKRKNTNTSSFRRWFTGLSSDGLDTEDYNILIEIIPELSPEEMEILTEFIEKNQ